MVAVAAVVAVSTTACADFSPSPLGNPASSGAGASLSAASVSPASMSPASMLGTRGAALHADAPVVTVSLTFDDTEDEQLAAAGVLEAHGLVGTFYVNSPRLHQSSAGRDDWLSIADVQAMQARGHEIGSHTLSHLHLTSLPEAEQRREVAGDRRELLRLGLHARSLAYPFGDVEAALDPEQGPSLPEIIAGAGFGSARDTNGFSLIRCSAGPETLPPDNVYRLRTSRSVNNAPPSSGGGPPLPPDTAETLLGWMDHAATCGGGYLPLVFHHVRPDCSSSGDALSYCFDLPELERLSEALARGQRCLEGDGGARCYGVEVATVSGALGDSALLPEPPEVFTLRNPSLERALGAGTECLQRVQGSQGTATFSRSTGAAHSGEASEHVAIAAPYVSSAELIVSRDFGACAHFATAGASYDLALHYRADPCEPGEAAPTLRSVVYRLTGDYRWVPFTLGVPFAAASPGSWVRHAVTTQAVPEGTIALSFGLRLESAGGVSVDDFEIAPGSGG